jgi:hypothetical protein
MEREKEVGVGRAGGRRGDDIGIQIIFEGEDMN